MSAEQIIINLPKGYASVVEVKPHGILIDIVMVPVQAPNSPVDGQTEPEATPTISDSEYIEQTPADRLWSLVQARAKYIQVPSGELAKAMLIGVPSIQQGHVDESAMNDGEEWLSTATADYVRVLLHSAPDAPENPKAEPGPVDVYGKLEVAIVAKVAKSDGNIDRARMVGALLNRLNVENLAKVTEPMLADALRFIDDYPSNSGDAS